MSEQQRRELEEKLLPILRCTCCYSTQLHLTLERIGLDLSIPLSRELIRCSRCGEIYPVTEDFIPIIWTPTLRKYLENRIVENSNLAANIEIYDAHSDNYCAHTRQDPQIAQRIRHAVIRLLNDESCGRVSSAKYHLDFGCGPGHVLEWLSDLNFLQVGLDVSLRNLRNVRRNTKALVVCGDAANMPFADKTFHLVTESSALHHIEDWTSVVLESCRVCSQYGGILLDSEPTKEQKAWGPLARAVFEARFPVYKVLSYAFKSKYMFRNIEQAKLNMLAEVHNRPGTGFLLEELHNLFDQAGFEADIIVSPTPNLESKANPNWQYVVLNLLSGRNPWNPKYGSFTALARPRSVDCSSLGSNL